MDELKARLKQDAQEIEASTSLGLQARIDASLHAARETESVTGHSSAVRSPARSPSWLVSGLTGLTAAVLVILLINWNRATETQLDDLAVDSQATSEESTPPCPRR